MAGAVIPIKNGFAYQAFYFWKMSLEMLSDDSGIESVSFELDEEKSFDDIIVEFKTEKYTSSGNIKKRYYQVKYHERNDKAIKASDLTSPAFINAKAKSFLQKAKEAVDSSDGDIEVVLLNSWRTDPEDNLCKLISNDDGSFNLSKLKIGQTARSGMGKLRKEWANHLGVDEEELFSILERVKIKEGKTMPALIDDLNVDLKRNKLKKIDEDFYRAAPYIPLIDDLHAKIKNGVVLDKKQMLDHFARLNIFTEFTDDNYLKIGVASFSDGKARFLNEVSDFLDLSLYFSSSRFCECSTWNGEIKGEIRKFASERIIPGVNYCVYLEAHQSVAFTLGYYAHQKTKKTLYPIQNNFNSEIWEYSEGNIHFDEDELELIENISDEGEFVVINVDLMDGDLKNDVKDYLKDNFPNKKIDTIDIYPLNPNARFVRDGNHCMKLAIETSKLLQQLPRKIRRKQWRLIFKAPNSFLLFLGQHATQFGEIQLMEYNSRGHNRIG